MNHYSVKGMIFRWVMVVLLFTTACSGLPAFGETPASGGPPAASAFPPPGTFPTPTRSPTAVPAPTSVPYLLTFDSTETLVGAVNEVWAQVTLSSSADGILAGSAPLKILKDDTDARTGLGCDSNMYTQIPGDFTVVSAALTKTAGGLSAVRLVYSLNPTIKCQDDNSTGVNTWVQYWLTAPGNHFATCKDKLNNSGPRPLITVTAWTFAGTTATAVCKTATELTTVTLSLAH